MNNDDSDNDPFGTPDEPDEEEDTDVVKYADPNEDLDAQVIDADAEIDSDDAFGSGDDEKYEGFAFTGSRKSEIDRKDEVSEDDRSNGSTDGEALDEDFNSPDEKFDGSDGLPDEAESVLSGDTEMENEAASTGSNSDASSFSSEPEDPKDDRAALRKMMAEEQKAVGVSRKEAAEADLKKGGAVKQQQSTFDALLNSRIKLQKALVATNSMTATSGITAAPSDPDTTIRAAENAALALWTSLNPLRSSLHTPNNPKKRSFTATVSTSSSDLWTEMQSLESTFLPQRRATLSKWSQRTNPATLPRQNKFSQNPTQQSLTSVLDQHLSGVNAERLIARTRVPRSCAPLQANNRVLSDPSIYDDADFYTLLLRELVDQRMADSNNTASKASTFSSTALPSLPSQRELKVKKQVDTKASKGRKMRYTVHEKLQNFMAPDDRGSWGERQRGELFGSLLGRKVQLGEDGADGESEDEGMEVDGVDGALRLFG